MEASEAGHVDIVKLLITAGASLKQKKKVIIIIIIITIMLAFRGRA